MEVLSMNENKDNYDDYDNFDYHNYYGNFHTTIRGLNGELYNHMFIYDYDSHL